MGYRFGEWPYLDNRVVLTDVAERYLGYHLGSWSSWQCTHRNVHRV